MAAPTQPIEFVQHKICPFAHRAWLTLEELNIPYEQRETSLTDKPAWFTEIYRSALGADPASTGKVPVIKDGDFVLTESAIVAAYLADKFGEKQGVFRTTPEEKARIAVFAEQLVGKVIKGFYALLSAQGEEQQAATKSEFAAAIAAVSKAYEASGGPYFLGDRVSLADILVYPWIARLSVLKAYRGFSVPQDEPQYAAYHRFVAAFSARHSAKATLQPDEFFIDGYASYAQPKK